MLVGGSLPLPIIHISHFSIAPSQTLTKWLKLSIMVKMWVANLREVGVNESILNQLIANIAIMVDS